MNVTVETPVTPTPPVTPAPVKRWGFWATLGFSAVIVIVHSLVQGISIGVMAVIQAKGNIGQDREALLESAIHNGFFLSVAIILSALVGSMVIVAFVWLRKGMTVREYLGIKAIPFKVYARWLGIGLIFLFGWEALNVWFEQPGSEWMAETYQTAKYLPLLWVAIVIAAPLMEELFFRGFLFEGLRDSRMGSTGAVLVTSIAWGAIHVQYDVFQMVMIGLLGVLLGIAKIKTRSLYIPLALHVSLNLLAMVSLTAAHSSITS